MRLPIRLPASVRAALGLSLLVVACSSPKPAEPSAPAAPSPASAVAADAGAPAPSEAAAPAAPVAAETPVPTGGPSEGFVDPDLKNEVVRRLMQTDAKADFGASFVTAAADITPTNVKAAADALEVELKAAVAKP